MADGGTSNNDPLRYILAFDEEKFSTFLECVAKALVETAETIKQKEESEENNP